MLPVGFTELRSITSSGCICTDGEANHAVTAVSCTQLKAGAGEPGPDLDLNLSNVMVRLIIK
jgi:hypothetical protein